MGKLKKQTVGISKSWMTGSELKNTQRYIRVENAEKFIKQRIKDAEFLASTFKGELLIYQGKGKLYINYLDLKGCHKIDTAYIY